MALYLMIASHGMLYTANMGTVYGYSCNTLENCRVQKHLLYTSSSHVQYHAIYSYSTPPGVPTTTPVCFMPSIWRSMKTGCFPASCSSLKMMSGFSSSPRSRSWSP